MRRKAMSNSASKSKFTAGALNVKSINTRPVPQRGGLRL